MSLGIRSGGIATNDRPLQAGRTSGTIGETSNRLQGMSDSERISVVLPTQAKKDLEKLCDIEKRSISNFVYLLIQEAIDQAKASGKLRSTDD